MRLGLWTMLRGSSLRRDLPELLRLVTEDGISTQRLIVTTDGPSPEYISEHGFTDGLLRDAVEAGVPPVQALQMATINPATLLGLDGRLGGIAPGRQADLLLLPDLGSFRPELVISRGHVVARQGRLLSRLPAIDWGRYNGLTRFGDRVAIADPDLYLLGASGEQVELPVIHFKSAVITGRRDVEVPVENGRVVPGEDSGLLHAALVNRRGGWISRGLLSGFADDLEGFASTYNTTTHLLALGTRPEAIARAALRVRELGGGIAVVRSGEIVYELSLPIAGMMSELSFDEVVEQNERLSHAMNRAGYGFHDILYTLLFLTCDFLPSLRLTPEGVLDVKSARPLIPAEKLAKSA